MRRSATYRSTALLDVPFGAFEKHLLRCFALAAFLPDKGKRRHTIADALVDWYEANRSLLGYRVAPLEERLKRGRHRSDFSGEVALRYTSRNLPVSPVPSHPPSALQKRLDWASATLRLTRNEATFLGAVVRTTHVQPVYRHAILTP